MRSGLGGHRAGREKDAAGKARPRGMGLPYPGGSTLRVLVTAAVGPDFAMTCILWFLWVRHLGAVQPCGLGLGPLVRLPSDNGCGLGHVKGLFAHMSGVVRRPLYSWGMA